MTDIPSVGPRRTPLEPWVLSRAGASDLAGLRRFQLGALRKTVARVKALSPFYATRLDGLEPGDLRSLDDLARLPFTTAEDVRREGMRLLCVGAGDVERIVTLPTSGTTGDPKRICFSAADQELTLDFFHHGMSVLVDPGDRVLILLPGERPGGVGDLLRRALAKMDVEGVVHGPVMDAQETLGALRDGRFDAAVGIPVQVLGLARRDALAGDPVRLKSVLLSTDHAPDMLVRAIESAWGCRVFDHYGTTEMGLGGGVECEAHAGYHLREADLLFEVVDPESGAPLPDGEYGDVVFTTLTREAMPLLRYRTGDRSRFGAADCPCGSRLRLLDKVRARLAERLRLGSGAVLDLAAVDEALFALPDVLDVHVGVAGASSVAGVDVATTLKVDILAAGAEDDRRALERRASRAVAAVPAIAGATRAGRLVVEVAVTNSPWTGSDGTAKRMLSQAHSPEVGV